MTNVSAVEKMAELMQQIEVNSPRVAALHYCLSETSRYIAELEQKLAKSQREFRAADATIENLQMQVEKLAAENARMKAAIETHKHGFVRCNCCGDELMCHTDDVCRALDDTPVTDAFLAEVRAQGVEMFAAHKRERQQALRSRSMRMSEEAAGMAADAENFADELRKGVQS